MRTQRRERSSDERCCSNDAARRDEKSGEMSTKRHAEAVKVKELSRVATPGWPGLCDTAAAGGVSNGWMSSGR